MIRLFSKKNVHLLFRGDYSLYDLFLILKYYLSNNKKYTYHKGGNVKWAYISYLPEPFYRKRDCAYLNTHQNKRESIILGEVLAELGYNFVVEQFNTTGGDCSRNYDLVFGHEPNFVKMAQKNPAAIKIYYSTGANWKYQNDIIEKRTKEFSASHRIHVSLQRLVTPHDSYFIADYILQIGSDYTLETFPEEIRKKVTLINQSSNLTGTFSLETKLKLVQLNHYLWIGGGGSILKGLDLVVDYFVKHEDLTLHIVGTIDADVNDYYSDLLKNSPNIIVHGFLDINSLEFTSIAYKAAFNIYPSGSEGGVPGSVIATMKFGVIPLTYRYASPSEIDMLGYQIKSLDAAGVEEAIFWSRRLSYPQFGILAEKNMEYSSAKWTIASFKSEFKNFVKNICK